MPPSRKQQAYDHIRRKLLSGELGPGDRLSNRVLATEIGISFIPVREAISQLVSEGLVEHRPGRGSFVASPTRDEIQELFEIREALETHAITRAVARIGDEEIEDLVARNDTLLAVVTDVRNGIVQWSPDLADRCLRMDANMHLALIRAAGNVRLMRLVSDLQLIARLFTGSWKFSDPIADLERTYDEHRRLLDAMRAREATTARDLLVQHVRVSCREALLAFEDRRGNRDGERPAGL